jgi:MFS family permease
MSQVLMPTSAGQVIGQFSIQWAAEWIGRKGAMWTFTAILTIVSLARCSWSIVTNISQSAIIESTCTTWWLWALGKFIGGIGIGSVQASLPVVCPNSQVSINSQLRPQYINEHAPSQIRGSLVVAYSM